MSHEGDIDFRLTQNSVPKAEKSYAILPPSAVLHTQQQQRHHHHIPCGSSTNPFPFPAPTKCACPVLFSLCWRGCEGVGFCLLLALDFERATSGPTTVCEASFSNNAARTEENNCENSLSSFSHLNEFGCSWPPMVQAGPAPTRPRPPETRARISLCGMKITANCRYST